MMDSIFGNDGADDILNGNINETQEDAYGIAYNNIEDENANADGDGDAGEQPGTKLEPKRRSVRNPRPRLTVDTLRGPRGIHTIEDYFKDIKYQGKGHEREDLNEIMHRLQHWAHRMYPMYKFDDVIDKIENLGKKKPLQVHMQRYRLGMLESQMASEQKLLQQGDDEDGERDEEARAEPADEPFDEFDALLGEQIKISRLATRTPASHAKSRYDKTPGTVSTAGRNLTTSTTNSSAFNTPALGRAQVAMSTPYSAMHRLQNEDDEEYATPLPDSQPSTSAAAAAAAAATQTSSKLTAEQMAKIAENRRLAQERLRAKQQQQSKEHEQLQQQQAMDLDMHL